jgi:6,7-dimethyl-8-ribityllumazine synthase
MSGEGLPDLQELDCHALRVGVVAAQWHPEIMDGLLGGAMRALEDADVEEPTVLRVPGSFELPVATLHLARLGYDAVVALGVVVRGGTPHFEYVCRAATDGLTRVSLDSGMPVGFGMLTCDTEDQARARAGLSGSTENKGYDAAHAALATAVTIRRLRRHD